MCDSSETDIVDLDNFLQQLLTSEEDDLEQQVLKLIQYIRLNPQEMLNNYYLHDFLVVMQYSCSVEIQCSFFESFLNLPFSQALGTVMTYFDNISYIYLNAEESARLTNLKLQFFASTRLIIDD